MPLECDDKRPPRVLVVDDDPVLRLAVSCFMQRLEFTVCPCENGQQAVEAFADQGADIVLMDAAMPVMDGFSACEAIRVLPNGEHVPIIMITGYDDEPSIDRAFACGATEYITKPILWPVLRNRIQQLVAAARAERQLRQDRAFFQSLLDAMPEPTVVIDRAGRVRWLNAPTRICLAMEEPMVERNLSLNRDTEALSAHWPDGDEPLAREQIIPRVSAQLDTSQDPVTLLLRHADADGNDAYSELHGRALRGGCGDPMGFILRFRDVTARERERRQLHRDLHAAGHLARSDPLTGLANRLRFDERLREALYAAGRHQRRLALLFIDLDGFKDVNDSFGHAAGDLMLQEIGARLRDTVRGGDTVARIGGDEFAVLLADIHRDAVVAGLCERLLGAISAPVRLDQGERSVGASIGVSLYPDHGSSSAALIQAADHAMYQVKKSGKNAVRFYSPAPDGDPARG
jgi:diguanylate cyclase (GGDEF)-like protein